MKISKEKRNQLILVIICSVAVVALMWFYLIRPRYQTLAQIAAAQKTANSQLGDIQSAIKHADSVAAELAQQTENLSNAENGMASGDLYSWTYNTIRAFKAPYPVDIPDIGHPIVGDVDLLPNFPFQQVRFTVTGTAYYHDLGRFISDFENQFPYMRLLNLQLQPATSGDSEKLTFRMDIVALIKSASS